MRFLDREQIEATGRRAAIVKADISEQEDVESMVEFIGEHFGRRWSGQLELNGCGFRHGLDRGRSLRCSVVNPYWHCVARAD